MSWVDEMDRYTEIAQEIEPTVTLRTKDSWLWTAMWIVMAIFTLGLIAIKMSLNKFLHEYATTIGPFHGYPREYPALSKRLLVHESQHTKQAVFWGWFVPIFGWFFGRKMRSYVGLLPMMVFYLILPFPLGLCYGRYRMELNADKAAWRWSLENDYHLIWVRKRAKDFANKVGGGQYGWSWIPPLVRRGFSRAAEKVIKDSHMEATLKSEVVS